MKRLIVYMAGILLLAGCSTTKHLPEGEILYTGQKKMIVENRSTTPVGETAMEEVEAALATAPNNSLLGSSTIRIPFPMGLWIYNGFVKYEKGFGRWIFNRFAAKPVLMSTVNPDIRQKAAANLLRDYGYFNGTVSYKTFIDPKDSLKAKLQYTVDMRNPYFIDTVYYHGFSERTLRIMNMSRRRSLISPGEQFNVTDLDGERTRISTLLQCRVLLFSSRLSDLSGGYDLSARRTCCHAHGSCSRHAFRCRETVLCRQESFLSVWQAGTDP